jgi:hypothetical protein
MALVLWSCETKPDYQLPPVPTQPPAQVPPPLAPPGMPAAPGVQPPGMPAATPSPAAPVAEAPLPRTELIPISDVEPEPDPDLPHKVKKGICKFPGPDLPPEALNGNYKCQLKLKDMPLGIPLPAVSCYIQNNVIKSKSRDPGINLNIKESKAPGFFASGTYKFGDNKLVVSACMRAKGVGKYSGSGKGVLNGDKKNKAKFTLTLTKQ